MLFDYKVNNFCSSSELLRYEQQEIMKMPHL